MTRIRHWMRKETELIPLKKSISFRQITKKDAEILSVLMDLSYQGTIDHEGETLEQCLEEMHGTLTGKYGELLEFASFLIEESGKAVSASIITNYKSKPLLAYSMTLPDYQGRGFGRFLIERSINGLAENGRDVVFLAVTEGNISAQNLYRKLGFTLEGPA